MKHIPKAVSPVVATVMLIIIAVGAAILLWSWTSGLIAPINPHASAGIDRIRISGIKLKNNGSNVVMEVYVQNIGSAPAEIVQISTLDLKGNLINTTTNIQICSINNKDTCSGNSKVVEPNTVAKIVWNMGSPNDKYRYGYIYFVSIITATGFEVRSSFAWNIQ